MTSIFAELLGYVGEIVAGIPLHVLEHAEQISQWSQAMQRSGSPPL